MLKVETALKLRDNNYLELKLQVIPINGPFWSLKHSELVLIHVDYFCRDMFIPLDLWVISYLLPIIRNQKDIISL